MTQRRKTYQGHLVALIAGALLPFSLAPYNHWFLSIIATTSLALLLKGLNGRQAIMRSYLFGVGMYGSGVSWVYGAIHDFGHTATPLAFALTAIFVLGMAILFALPFYLYGKFTSRSRAGYIFGFSAVWLIGEWFRSWILTGFPWLFAGYAHLDTWLSGWAPVIGVMGIGFLSVLSGTLMAEFLQQMTLVLRPERKADHWRLTSCILLISAIWSSGYLMQGKNWGTHVEESASVTIIQPNIPLEVKWNPAFREDIMDTLTKLTEPHWDSNIIIWPEASVPLMYHQSGLFFEELAKKAEAHQSGLITGVLYDDPSPGIYYNSVTGIGATQGIYFKQRLVPFGEYVPMEDLFRGLINFFNLPMSIIYPGPKDQDILHYKNYKISPSICYEIVYPDLVARMAKDAQLLLTISNDAWFGTSIGPKQHFQIARMRALENHRYLIRGTNTGISGFIDPYGKVVVKGKQFDEETIDHTIQFIKGATPYTRYGSTPIVVLAFLCIGLLALKQRTHTH